MQVHKIKNKVKENILLNKSELLFLEELLTIAIENDSSIALKELKVILQDNYNNLKKQSVKITQ